MGNYDEGSFNPLEITQEFAQRAVLESDSNFVQ